VEQDLLGGLAKREELEEAEIRDVARRACIYRRELVRQDVPAQDLMAMMYGWYTIEGDRLREERRDRE
jgi:hypothetical protein